MLTISRASAGSGKTFRLTGEYLKLLFREYSERSVMPYRHILAVTFTNKATAEMKDRILSELDKLSSGADSPYLLELCRSAGTPGLSDAENEKNIRKNAGILLRRILNDYTGFNISTIDSFFQSVLRAFAREMGQSSSYNVELDIRDVLMQAVDSMLNSLDEADKDELLRWLIDMAVDGIEQGGGWDITGRLNALGEQLFNEKFKMQGDAVENALADRANLQRYRRRLQSVISEYRRRVSALSAEALQLISEAGLTVEDFPYGKKSGASRLPSLASGEMSVSVRFLNMASAESPDSSWVSSSSKNKGVISGLFYGRFGDDVREIGSMFTGAAGREYRTACVIRKNFSTLGVLMDIRSEVDKWCRENDTVILPETNSFLHRVIDRDETPFIYEKVGTRIDHYMLDEFQDTSAMQWDNFRPLVRDSVDSGRDCLIVGDVKQSIYRWRNSDWRLLQDSVFKDFDPMETVQAPLNVNYRSGKTLVEFNNGFFKWAGERMQGIYESVCGAAEQSSLISSIYSDVAQRVPPSLELPEGHVMVEFVEGDDEAGWKEKVLELLPGKIANLLDSGFRAGDIAFLVRSNDDGALVSDYLLKKGYAIVTEDSLRISSSRSVCKVVSVLRYIQNPDDRIVAKLFEESGVDISGIADLPLYELCERIITLLPEEDLSQVAFLLAFMDTVRDFCSRDGSDVKEFLKWWGDAGVKLSVSIPDSADSIKVMTIHKSKGLGFGAVVIPFLTSPFFRNRGILWCSASGTEFDDLGLIPVDLSSSLSGTAFEQDYRDEMLYQYIDNLNTVYVAFTRACGELHVFSENKKPGKEVKDMGQLLRSYLDSVQPGSAGKFEFGERCRNVYEEKEDDGSGILEFPEQYISCPDNGRIRVSLRNAEAMSEPYRSRMHGILMHSIFSRIVVEGDAPAVIEKAVRDGELPASDKEEVGKEVLGRLREAVSEGYGWFTGEYSVMNEVTVLSPDDGEIRPDRVMVRDSEAVVLDYKFGAERDVRYERQVRTYMRNIREMGYTSVTGYLWYRDGIQSVDP